jgi:hypothetical protein
MSRREPDPRRLRERDVEFYSIGQRNRDNPSTVRQPTTAKIGARIGRPRGDSYRPSGHDNPDLPSGFGRRGRRGGPTALTQRSNAVRPRAYAEKPWLLTNAVHDDEADDDEDADNDTDETQLRKRSPESKRIIADGEHAAKVGVEDKLQKVSVRALARDETIERRLPDQLWLSMRRDKAWLYPPEMVSWHADSSGADAPTLRKLALAGRLKAHVASNVAITFRNGDGGIVCSAGSMFKPEEGAPELRCIELNWITHSQLPGLHFKIRRGTGHPPAHVWLYANNLRISTEQKSGHQSFVMSHQVSDGIHHGLNQKAGFKPPRGTGAIWETRFSTWSEEAVIACSIKGVPLIPARPKVSSISQVDLDRVIATGAMAKTKGDLAVLSTGDWALWGLLTTNDIHVCRSWDENEEGIAVYNFFVQYMDMQLDNVLRYGDWPHYVRQARKAGKDLYAPDFDLRELEVPRNMVRFWRIKWQEDVPVAAEPETWAAYPVLAVYPNKEAEAFGRRIGAERGNRPGVERGRGRDRGRGQKHSILADGPQKAATMAQKSNKKPDDDKNYGGSFSAMMRTESPLAEQIHRTFSFGKIPALRKECEETVEINQKRRRSMAKSENSAPDADGDTIMAAENPATERLVEDQPTAKRQRIDKSPVLRQTIVHGLPAGQRSYQQGPSVEEENALFANDEQAIGKKPRVVVRLPW